MRKTSIALYLVSFIPIIVGLNKLFVYENPESYYRESKNAYVGGDAYNYIINAGQASAYFTLAIFIAVIASALLIISFLNEKQEETESPSSESKSLDSEDKLTEEEVS